MKVLSWYSNLSAVKKGILFGTALLMLIVGLAETYQNIGIHSLGITLLALGSALFIALGLVSSEAENKKHRCGSIWNERVPVEGFDELGHIRNVEFSVKDYCKFYGMNQMTPIWELKEHIHSHRHCFARSDKKGNYELTQTIQWIY